MSVPKITTFQPNPKTTRSVRWWTDDLCGLQDDPKNYKAGFFFKKKTFVKLGNVSLNWPQLIPFPCALT